MICPLVRLCAPLTIYVIVCHHMSPQQLFICQYIAHTFVADSTHGTHGNTVLSFNREIGIKPPILRKENSCSSEHGKLCFVQQEIILAAQNNLPLA